MYNKRLLCITFGYELDSHAIHCKFSLVHVIYLFISALVLIHSLNVYADHVDMIPAHLDLYC